MGKKLKHLERTMRTFQNVDRMEYEPIVSALHECIEADEYVYTYMRNEGEQTAFFPLRNEEGDVFIPVFLSVLSAKALEEQAREYKLSLALFKFSGLPDLADISDSISGLVFEPFDFGFIATAPLLWDSAERKETISHVTLISGDITGMSAEAMVCPTDQKMSGQGSIEKKLKAVLGDREEPEENDLHIGDIMVSENDGKGREYFDYDYFLYIVAPGAEDQSLLKTCYYTALECARQVGLRSIMFPCIGTGSGRIDVDTAIKESTEAVISWMEHNEDYCIDAYFCCPDEDRMQRYQEYFDSMQG